MSVTESCESRKDLIDAINNYEESNKKLNGSKIKYCIKLSWEYEENAPDYFMDAKNLKKEYLLCQETEQKN